MRALAAALKILQANSKGPFDDVPTFACIECGEAVLFRSEDSGGTVSWLFVELPFVDDVDRIAAGIGDRVSHDGPADRPWGSLELSLQDPDGHTLQFSCPVQRRAPG